VDLKRNSLKEKRTFYKNAWRNMKKRFRNSQTNHKQKKTRQIMAIRKFTCALLYAAACLLT